jgi:hypothetical protein
LVLLVDFPAVTCGGFRRPVRNIISIIPYFQFSRGGNMNGLKCYLTREQVKQLIQSEIEKKLDPSQLLGDFTVDVALCDDGRVEITYWKRDTEDYEATHNGAEGMSSVSNDVPASPGDHLARVAAN